MRQMFIEKEAVAMKEMVQPFLGDHVVLVSVYYSFLSSGEDFESLVNAQEGLFGVVSSQHKKLLQLLARTVDPAATTMAKRAGVRQSSAFGYSCAGRVIAIGRKVQRLSVGDWVACAGAGDAYYADLMCIEEHVVVRVSSQQYIRDASIITAGTMALQGVRRARLLLGEHVCVIGMGLMGQLIVQLAKIAGCTVIALDVHADRLALAKAMGADVTYQIGQDDVAKEIRMLTEQHGVDVTIITSVIEGSSVIEHAIDITRPRGRVVVVGQVGLEVNQYSYAAKEVELIFASFYEATDNNCSSSEARSAVYRHMQAFVQLIEQKKITIHALGMTEIGVDTIDQVHAYTKRDTVLGILVRYGHDDKEAQFTSYTSRDIKTPLASIAAEREANVLVQFAPAVRDILRLGVVGAGDVAKRKLLPAVTRMKHTSIDAVVDADITNALSVSRLYGASKVYPHVKQLFGKNDLDAVIISSPHVLHGDHALYALQHGTAVFLEKPMVTNRGQLERLRVFLSQHPHAPFCVDYDRSSAPFVKKIKSIVEKRSTPLTIVYRMNVGLIPREKWAQTDVGAGRIIGDACHIFDLFCFLTNAVPVSVSVETMHASRDDIFPTDNFSAQIRFDDGSVCTLIYTSLGHADLGRERMEVFVDGKTMVLDDYIRLFGFGVPAWFNETALKKNRGHDALLKTFFDNLKQPQFVPPISFDRLFVVAELSLLIDQLACEDGGNRRL